MSGRTRLGLGLAILAVAIAHAACATVTREPVVLPRVDESYAAPYDAVWEAALKAVGIVRTVRADKVQGRIETEPYIFRFGFGDDAGQTLLVSLTIAVRPAGDRRTEVQVETRVHEALLTGIMPGPFNNPWTDYLIRLRENLRLRS